MEETERCMYCGADVLMADPDTVPEIDDDEAWEELSKDHGKDCEWIETRAHRRGQED